MILPVSAKLHPAAICARIDWNRTPDPSTPSTIKPTPEFYCNGFRRTISPANWLCLARRPLGDLAGQTIPACFPSIRANWLCLAQCLRPSSRRLRPDQPPPASQIGFVFLPAHLRFSPVTFSLFSTYRFSTLQRIGFVPQKGFPVYPRPSHPHHPPAGANWVCLTQCLRLSLAQGRMRPSSPARTNWLCFFAQASLVFPSQLFSYPALIVFPRHGELGLFRTKAPPAASQAKPYHLRCQGKLGLFRTLRSMALAHAEPTTGMMYQLAR